MKKSLIAKMKAVVEAHMEMFKTDFYKYDMPYIKAATPEKFPVIWIVSRLHTYLLKLGSYKEQFERDERTRFAYADGDDTFSSYFTPYSLDSDDLIYLITERGLSLITAEDALKLIKQITESVVEAWVAEHGPLPSSKVRVRLHNITISQLKTLIKDCETHGDNSLLLCMKRFHRYVQQTKDHWVDITYHSGGCFSFTENIGTRKGLVGAIKFHGWPETGYQTNNSIQLTPAYGWSTHT